MITCIKKEIDNNAYFTYFDSSERIIRLATKWSKHLSSLINVSYSSKTALSYSKRLKIFLEWVENSGYYQNLSIDEILTVLDREFLEEWVKSEKKDKAYQSTVKEFLCWLQTEKAGRVRNEENNPFKSGKLISRARNKSTTPKCIPADEFIALIKGLYNESERCFFHTLFDMGLRLSEGIELKRKDLPDTKYFPDVNYYPMVIAGAKGIAGSKNYRLAFISRAMLERINEYHQSPGYRFAKSWHDNDPNKPMFLSTRKEILTDSIAKQLKAASKRGKDNSTLDKNKSYHCHILRHSAALSYLLSELGKDYPDKLLLIKSILGHRQAKTTEIYSNIPVALLNKKDINYKYLEAEKIYNETKLVYPINKIKPSKVN